MKTDYQTGERWLGNGPRTRRRRREADCVSQMQLFRSDPGVLAEALEELGFTEATDNFPVDE